MGFNIELPLSTVIAIFAVFISSISILYTWRQNKRRIDVYLTYSWHTGSEEDDEEILELSAFNDGFHSIALIDYNFIVKIHYPQDGKYIHFKPINFPEFDEDFDFPEFRVKDLKQFNVLNYLGDDKLFPLVLKEGEIIKLKFNFEGIAKMLKSGGYLESRVV